MSGPALCQEVNHPSEKQFTFERTRDFGLIKSIATHPRVYPAISDDYSPAPEDWKPFIEEAVQYILAKYDDELLGMWVLIPENRVNWKVHTCLLPAGYGSRGAEAARVGIEWVFANSPCLRISTEVPEYNQLALRFSMNAGMKIFGFNPGSYMKNGILQGQILLGVSKKV